MELRVVVALLGALLQAVLWTLVIAADPFGMSTAADRVSESTFLKFYAFAYPSFAPSRVRDDVVVLSYDEANLPHDPANPAAVPRWPLPRAMHNALLQKILALHPKAVFFDLLFDTNADSDKAASAALLKTAQASPVPVIFASYAADNPHKLIPALQGLPQMRASAGTASRGAFRASVQMTAEPGHYPLIDADGNLFAASALYAAAHPPLPPAAALPDEMLVAWGITLPGRYRHDLGNLADCSPFFDGWRDRAGDLLRTVLVPFFDSHPNSKGGWNKLQPCAYHVDLPAKAFFEDDTPQGQARLSRLVAGSYILIGARIAGSSDDVTSPVNGKLPGVYLHAMALDNLLSFKGSPIVSSRAYLPLQVALIFAALAIGKLVFGERIPPASRRQALRELFDRLSLWAGFALSSAILLFATLLLHLAPYNWGAVFVIAGGAFLAGSERAIEMLVFGKKSLTWGET